MKHILMTISLIALSGAALASGDDSALTHLQDGWAHANYEVQDQKQKESSFEALLKEADQAVEGHPNDAELLIWRGIIKSTFAGVEGGLGALKIVKSSKDDFEAAMNIDPASLQGSAYTSLGTLYYKVPGWPLSFGDDDKAEELLQKALQINAEGIDPNYFYADYLKEDGRYTEAKLYYEKALAAPDRPNRRLADSGRRAEIQAALKEVDAQLN